MPEASRTSRAQRAARQRSTWQRALASERVAGKDASDVTHIGRVSAYNQDWVRLCEGTKSIPGRAIHVPCTFVMPNQRLGTCA